MALPDFFEAKSQVTLIRRTVVSRRPPLRAHRCDVTAPLFFQRKSTRRGRFSLPVIAAGFTAGDNRRVRGRQIAVSDVRAIGQQHTHQGQREKKKKKSAPRSHSSRRQKERNGPQEETAVTRGTTTQARARRPAPRQSDDDDAASRKARTARRHVSPGRRCSGEGVFFSPRCCRGRCHQLLPPLFVGARANVVRGESTTVQPQVARWRR